MKYGNRFKRCIYSYEFIEDKSVYVGLTFNINDRQNSRNRSETDQVTKHIKKTNHSPIRKQLTEYLDVIIASKLEGEYLEKYKQDGWNILNVAKTGGIGGTILYWTKERCFDAAKLCTTRSEFSKKFRGAHSSSMKHGWIDEIYLNIKSTKGGKIIYTKEMCSAKSILCKTKKDFKELYKCEFNAAYRWGWLDDITSHMTRKLKWTKESCFNVLSECKSKEELKKKYKGAYNALYINNWMTEFFNNKKFPHHIQ